MNAYLTVSTVWYPHTNNQNECTIQILCDDIVHICSRMIFVNDIDEYRILQAMYNKIHQM